MSEKPSRPLYLRGLGLKLLVKPESLSSRYVPPRLPHRDEQVDRLYSLVRSSLEGAAQVVQLIGPVGTGKTSSDALVMRRLVEEAQVTHLYVNLKLLSEPSPWLVFSHLASQLGARISRSISAGEAFLKLTKLIERESPRRVVITVDEADELVGTRSLKGGRVVYSLTRLQELGVRNVAAVIFIARREEWSIGLSAEERSTLGRLVVRYPPYTYEQIVDIVLYRVADAFRSGAFLEEAAELIARVTLDLFEGDIRAALDLALYAGLIAENEGADRVSQKHVEKAVAQLSGRNLVSEELVDTLSRKERLVLAAAILSALQLGQLYVPLSLLKESVDALARHANEKITEEERDAALQKLHDAGLLKVSGPLRVYVAAAGFTEPGEYARRVLEKLGYAAPL
ncbi:MAG: AAA family ATPase [Thermofilum sp.]|nr:AAA family ATPase [Thermofilum sp.]MCC6058772.1 AAA family ATPase [Thermofilum sp.]